MPKDLRVNSGDGSVITPSGKTIHVDEVVFARGFVFVASDEGFRPAGVPESWQEIRLPGWAGWYDPRLLVTRASWGGAEVIALGFILDLDGPLAPPTAVVKKLAKGLHQSREEFFALVSRLAGRYLLIDVSQHGTFVQSDAVALRSLYSAPDHRVFGSHQNLVATTAGIRTVSEFGRASWWHENNARTYPGYYTHWEGVFLVPANHQLTLREMLITRVPLPSIEELSVVEACDRLEADFEVQIRLLAGLQNPVVSLTAGADSRVTVAATRELQKEFRYYTYGLTYSKRRKAVEIDLKDSQRVAKAAQVQRYDQFLIDGPLEAGALKNLLSANSPRSSNLNVSARYLDEFSSSEILLRSNTFEIATGSYQRLYGYRTADAEILSNIHVFQKDYTSNTLRALDEYWSSSKLGEVVGYDPLDLYYMEIRMGSWLNQVIHESDPSVDSHILVNSRSILAYLLSVNLEDRIASRVYKEYVSRKCRALTLLPVNGQPYFEL